MSSEALQPPFTLLLLLALVLVLVLVLLLLLLLVLLVLVSGVTFFLKKERISNFPLFPTLLLWVVSAEDLGVFRYLSGWKISANLRYAA
jgi:hypothetical protein